MKEEVGRKRSISGRKRGWLHYPQWQTKKKKHYEFRKLSMPFKVWRNRNQNLKTQGLTLYVVYKYLNQLIYPILTIKILDTSNPFI